MQQCETLRILFTFERIKISKFEIFAEYKYTLNELPVKKCFFNTSNSLRDMANDKFYWK